MTQPTPLPLTPLPDGISTIEFRHPAHGDGGTLRVIGDPTTADHFCRAAQHLLSIELTGRRPAVIAGMLNVARSQPFTLSVTITVLGGVAAFQMTSSLPASLTGQLLLVAETNGHPVVVPHSLPTS